MAEEKGNPYVSDELCKSRQETIRAEIAGLRNQIIGAISLSTMILLAVNYLK